MPAVTTDAGTWFAPGTRAIWVPAGVNPLGLDTPTVLDVGPLLPELIRIDVFRRAYGHTPDTHHRAA